jgi:hypothetical protein
LAYDTETHGEVIPLAEDLSNAIIATCKGPSVAVPIVTPTPDAPITTNIPVAQSQIFDPVWKTSTIIPDAEHQVSQHQHGVVDASAQTAGPTGDLYPAWKYTNGEAQPFQAAGNSWSNEGAGGSNSSDASTNPTNYGPNPTPDTVLLEFLEVPSEEVSIPVDHAVTAERKWVELPDCSGAEGEVKLYLNKENATSATCKPNPSSGAPVAPAL